MANFKMGEKLWHSIDKKRNISVLHSTSKLAVQELNVKSPGKQ